LARQLAHGTGERITQAVRAAVRERLDRVGREDQAVVLVRVARRRAISQDATGPLRSPPQVPTTAIRWTTRSAPRGDPRHVGPGRHPAAEPDAEQLVQALGRAAEPRLSAVPFFETAIVVDANHDPVPRGRLDDFLAAARVPVESVTERQAEIARRAYRQLGAAADMRPV
jgi:hypothetical protein